MRSTAADTDLPLNLADQVRSIRWPSLLARIHWPRLIGLVVALGMWPAIFFLLSRLF